MSSATDLFHKEGIQITLQGRRHLGAALGSRSFTEEYVTSKVTSWVKETVKLTTYASLLSLPTRLGGLGIMNPSEATISQYMSSLKITAPLVTLIIQQSTEYTHTTKLEQH